SRGNDATGHRNAARPDRGGADPQRRRSARPSPGSAVRRLPPRGPAGVTELDRIAAAPGAAPGAATPPAEPPWHTLEAEAAAARLGTPLETGLTGAEAARRLAKYGPNRLREQAARGPLSILLGQFADVMIVLLIGAALLAGAIG